MAHPIDINNITPPLMIEKETTDENEYDHGIHPTVIYIDSDDIELVRENQKAIEANCVLINGNKWNIKEIIKFINLLNLRELHLATNNITEIKNIDNLVNLQELYLPNNNITEIKNIDNLVNLRVLHLANNNITEIKNIDNLVNLRVLHLATNKITEIKNIGTMVNLRDLVLSYNKITEIKNIDNLVNLRYLDLAENKITEIKNIDNLVNLEKLDLSNNKITEIKNIDTMVNLHCLDLSNNMITEIKNIDYMVNLRDLDLYNNMITEIKNIDTMVNLRDLDLSYNKITEIKNIDNLVNLRKLMLHNNMITEIKNIDTMVNLQNLCLYNNMITEIKNIDTMVNLQKLDLRKNNITEIPLTILNNINLILFTYDENIIVNPIITRFLNRHTIKSRKIAVYNDNQNVHNSDITKSISQSIYAILNTPEKNNELYMNDIVDDLILTSQTKESLVEYNNYNDVHSILSVTFAEVLQSVWCVIQKHKDSVEIKKILNTEMSDSLDKCFTGRLSRLINTLSGFDDRVCIKISDNDGIGNIIIMIIAKNKDMNSTEQKEICKLELLSRGYEQNIIDEWIEYI